MTASKEPRPGTKAALQAEVRTLRLALTKLKADYSDLPATRAELRDLRTRYDHLSHDMQRVADRLLHEARRRVWCGEYEVFARVVNRGCKKPRLIMRMTDGCTCQSCVRRAPADPEATWT